MHQSRAGLLDLVLENTLSEYKKGWSHFEDKADQSGALLERADPSFMNSVTASSL
jgi:hypothetical protein